VSPVYLTIGPVCSSAKAEHLVLTARTDALIRCLLRPQNSSAHGYLTKPRHAEILTKLERAPLLASLTCQAPR
jgi:hypothetical protein